MQVLYLKQRLVQSNLLDHRHSQTPRWIVQNSCPLPRQKGQVSFSMHGGSNQPCKARLAEERTVSRAVVPLSFNTPFTWEETQVSSAHNTAVWDHGGEHVYYQAIFAHLKGWWGQEAAGGGWPHESTCAGRAGWLPVRQPSLKLPPESCCTDASIDYIGLLIYTSVSITNKE